MLRIRVICAALAALMLCALGAQAASADAKAPAKAAKLKLSVKQPNRSQARITKTRSVVVRARVRSAGELRLKARTAAGSPVGRKLFVVKRVRRSASDCRSHRPASRPCPRARRFR